MLRLGLSLQFGNSGASGPSSSIISLRVLPVYNSDGSLADDIWLEMRVSEAVTVDLVLTNSLDAPTPAQISGGQDHTGASALASFQNLSRTPTQAQVDLDLTGISGSGLVFHARVESEDTVRSTTAFSLV